MNSEKAIRTRKVCSKHNDSSFYTEAIKVRSAETTANIAITLIHQTDVFLRKLLERLQGDFLRNGGIKEQMYRARIKYRSDNQPPQSPNRPPQNPAGNRPPQRPNTETNP